MKRFLQLTFAIIAIALLILPLPAQAASSGAIRAYDDQQVNSLDLSGKEFREAEFYNRNFDNSNFSNADLLGAVFNTVIMTNSNWHGVDFTYGIAYRVDFANSDLSDGIFTEATMLDATFNNVDVTGADFTGTILDKTEIKKMCANASGVNSKTGVDTRESLGCSSLNKSNKAKPSKGMTG